MKKFMILSCLLVMSLFSQEVVDRSKELKVKIEVLPGTEVEVGEEVYFSGSKCEFSDKRLLKLARYEWDFGDGTYLRYSPTDSRVTRSGICCVHYFMKPGEYEVKLTVSVYEKFQGDGKPMGDPIAKGVGVVKIKVTGEEPMKGFEVQHAPFHNRLGQYLYVEIPKEYRGNDTKLKVRVKGKKTNTEKILFDKTNLSGEEKVLLRQRELPKDEYELIVELYDKEGKRIPGGIWKEKFTKHYEDMPKVGIDENNSIWLNGKLFFPIASYMTRKGESMEMFKRNGVINSLVCVGYYDEHTPDTFADYLNAAKELGLYVIGPHRGDYEVQKKEYAEGVEVNRWRFNNNPDRMIDYIKRNKDHPNLLGWSWIDEPNIGGRANQVYPPVLAAWEYICHKEDPDHLTMQLYTGGWHRLRDPFKTPFNISLTKAKEGMVPRAIPFDYIGSLEQFGESLFGGKRWITQVFSYDHYPIVYRDHPANNWEDMGPYAVYIDGFEAIKYLTKNLVPIIPCIIPNRRRVGDADWKVPTEEMIYMEVWMNVVLGAKGIVWFPFFDKSTLRWNAMKKAVDQIERLKEVILGPEPERKVKDDANEALKRVETMIREKDGYVYIFAVRITEPDPVPEVKYQGKEPDSIEVNFEVSGISGEKEIEVIDENRKIKITDGKFKDIFKKYQVHIYKIPL